MYFLLKMGIIHSAMLVYQRVLIYVRSGLNSHYFHIIGDKLINPSPGKGFIGPHEIRIPVVKGWRWQPIPKDQGVDRPDRSYVVGI